MIFKELPGDNEQYICIAEDSELLNAYYKNVLKLNGFVIVVPIHITVEDNNTNFAMIVEKEVKQTDSQKIANIMEKQLWLEK